MKILMVAVEAKPYATAGGTSDVVGALSQELRRHGCDVRLVLPYYSAIIHAPPYRVEQLADLDVPAVGRPVRASVYRTNRTTYLVGGDPFGYWARVGQGNVPVYPEFEDSSVDAGELYAFFSLASLELTRRFCENGWQPDVIHCHDWPTGLFPAYLKRDRPNAARFRGTKAVFTVHNMSDVVYQGGWFGPGLLTYAGLPKRLFHDGHVQHKGHVNFMKSGIVFSDRVNTVSEGYAQEISSSKAESFVTLDGTQKRFKCSGGLDSVWARHGVSLIGIRNGIDNLYDPARIGEGEDWQLVDQDWTSSYATASGQTIAGWAYDIGDPHLGRKKHDIKCYLQERCNRMLNTRLEVSAEIPLIAVRSRLTEQKGFDLIVDGLKQWNHDYLVQFIIVAWGEERYAKELRRLATAHPDWIAFSDSWKAAPEPLHYAGADMLLMPSIFEPCGLPHMMALRYGTVPIVRRTGGLADVVQDYDPSSRAGNGFVFGSPNPRGMLQAVERALEVYHLQPDHWQALVVAAMRARDRNGQDFSWTTAADRYMRELYEIDCRTDTSRESSD
jgi:starch synthase